MENQKELVALGFKSLYVISTQQQEAVLTSSGIWTSSNEGNDYEWNDNFIQENNGSRNYGRPKLQVEKCNCSLLTY